MQLDNVNGTFKYYFLYEFNFIESYLLKPISKRLSHFLTMAFGVGGGVCSLVSEGARFNQFFALKETPWKILESIDNSLL